MDDPSREQGERTIEERRTQVASWLAEHLMPAAHVLAEDLPEPAGFETREYQLDALAALWAARRNGQTRALLEMATGLGKTFVAACDVMKFREEWEASNPGTSPRMLFVSHRHEINEQARQDFIDVMAELETDLFRTKRTALPDVDMRFAVYQSILSELDRFDPEDYEYIVWDEVHHSEAETFRTVRDYFDPVFELGLTATPRRMDELDIRDYFGEAVYKKDLPEAMAEGWLADVDYHIVFDAAVKAVMESGFDPKTLRELYELLEVTPRNEEIAQNIIDERHRIGLDNAKTMVFCQDVAQADIMAKLLGGRAYHSKILKKDRASMLTDFRNGNCQILTTRDMVNEGVNVPDTALIVFLRSTGSEAVFLQQLGRGLRGRGKRVTVLDFAANIERIVRIRALSEAVRCRAEEMGETTKENPGDGEGEDIGLSIRTGHTGFDFDRLAISLLEKLGVLQDRVAAQSVLNDLTNEDLAQYALSIKPDGPLGYDEIVKLSKDGKFIGVSTVAKRFGGIPEFQEACGFKPLNRMTNEELVELALSLKPGGPLSSKNIRTLFENGTFISYHALLPRFGSLAAFHEACGFKPLDARYLSNDRIVALALDLQSDRPLSSKDIKELSANKIFVGMRAITSRFGTIAEFHRACGFDVPERVSAKVMSNDEIVALARRLKPIGVLNSSEIDSFSKQGAFISQPTVKARFGSLEAFYDACGAEKATELSGSQIITMALQISPDAPLQYASMTKLAREGRFVYPHLIRKLFGSVVKFQQACGFNILDGKNMTNDEIVALALEIHSNSPLTHDRIQALSGGGRFFSPTFIARRFGSLERFQRACGFKPTDQRNATRNMDNKQIIELAIRLKPSGPLSLKEIQALSGEGDFVSTGTIYTRFGSLLAFHQACGFLNP